MSIIVVTTDVHPIRQSVEKHTVYTRFLPLYHLSLLSFNQQITASLSFLCLQGIK